ncbi:MAG: DMT family transporter [Alphaproteobacteria bacterium]|nr:DMT family transporter [Alphaproteobacteria bacterium]
MQSGVFLILLSVSLTPLGDGLSKYLGQTQSPFFIVFLRYFVAGVIAVIAARATGTPLEFPRRGRGGLLVRTALVMAAMTLLIVALTLIPLAHAVGGFLIAPIVAMLISVSFYGEKLTLARLFGAVISLLGAVLILLPGAELEVGMLIALTGGMLLGAFLALTRQAKNQLNAMSTLTVQCLMGSVMLLPLAASGMAHFHASLIWPALGLGGVTAATHLLTVLAYQRADSARLAPFFYFNLVAAIVVGLVWFNEIPSRAAILGLSAIIFGGLVSLIRSPNFAITIKDKRQTLYAAVGRNPLRSEQSEMKN